MTPGWYYPLAGVLTGGFVASFASPRPLVFLGAGVVYFGTLLVLDAVIGHKSGLTMTITSAAKVGRQTIALKVAVLLGLVIGVIPKLVFNWGWAPIVAGIALVPAVIVLGRRSEVELARASQPA